MDVYRHIILNGRPRIKQIASIFYLLCTGIHISFISSKYLIDNIF